MMNFFGLKLPFPSQFHAGNLLGKSGSKGVQRYASERFARTPAQNVTS